MYEFIDTPGVISASGAKLLYTSIYDERGIWRGTLHVHDFWEAFFCLGGSCEFHIRGEAFETQAQELVLISPGVEHTEYNLGNRWVCIAFRYPQLTIPDRAAGYLRVRQAGEIASLSHMLFEEAKGKQVGYLNACGCLLELILLRFRRVGGQKLEVPAPSAQDGNRELRRHSITWVKEYIDANYPHELNLDMLSEKIGLNKFSLIREFKQTYSVSPMEYLLSCRFREAKFLLSTTNHSIKFIGRGVGFSSGSYFSQQFQKREGLSPSAYRRLHQGQTQNKDSPECE